jgi:hypothetical protein
MYLTARPAQKQPKPIMAQDAAVELPYCKSVDMLTTTPIANSGMVADPTQ